jgi:hypothetical protein
LDTAIRLWFPCLRLPVQWTGIIAEAAAIVVSFAMVA